VSARRARLAPAVAAALLAGLIVTAAAAPAAPHLVTRWGSEGTAPGQFGRGNELSRQSGRQFDDPAGIAVDRKNRVLVADPSNNRVERYTRDGRYLNKFGRLGYTFSMRGALAKRLYVPQGVAVDYKGNYFVVDNGNDRVMKYNSRWRLKRRIAERGAFPGQVLSAEGIATSRRFVYVVDQGSYRVERFSLAGRYRGSFGTFGRNAGQFVYPYGVAVDPKGKTVYVADQIRDKVLIFGATGKFFGEFGAPGQGPGEFLHPTGVAVAPDSSVYVSDRCNQRIEHFTAAGEFIEQFGHGITEAPTFLTFDRDGNLYVADYHRVVKFGLGAGAASATPIAGAAHHNGVDIICRHVAEQLG